MCSLVWWKLDGGGRYVVSIETRDEGSLIPRLSLAETIWRTHPSSLIGGDYLADPSPVPDWWRLHILGLSLVLEFISTL